jgi:hypothetical protein
MIEPNIIEIIKAEKMYPNGKDLPPASCSEGTHRNTKRYIDPSKQV